MQILNSKLKKARIKKEKRDRFWLKIKSRKIIRYIRKQYKRTGSTEIYIDLYKFNEELLIKVLNLLKSEHQLNFNKVEDYYVINLKEPTQVPKFNKVQPAEIIIETKSEPAEKTESPATKPVDSEQPKVQSTSDKKQTEEYKPF